MHALTSTEALAQRLAQPDAVDRLRLFDATVHLRPAQPGHYVVESGRADYEAAHIPSAAFIDLGQELSDPHSTLRFTMPPAVRSTAAWPSGGLKAGRWLAAANAILPAASKPGSTRRAGPTRTSLLRCIGSDTVCTINALTASVHAGTAELNYGRKGHIKGSVNMPYPSLLNAGGCFKPAAELHALFDGTGAFERRRVICYCGGGISATMDALALHRAGHAAEAVAATRAGKPIPYATVLPLAAYAARVDANGVQVKDAKGRFIKDKLVSVNSMMKGHGFGADVPAAVRNGDWIHQSFSPERKINDKANLTACLPVPPAVRDG